MIPITGEWRKVRDEEFNNFHSSPNIITVVETKMMRWVWRVPRIAEIRAHNVLAGNLEGPADINVGEGYY